MFTRLRVQNYQSIESADLELAPFTVIVGENRAGKSALLRALISLITNKTGTGFIRNGRTECRVVVNTQEGNEVEWIKNRTTASYVVDGRDYTKLAGSVPDDVVGILGVRGIEVDNSVTVWPQLHRENDSVFLIRPHLTSGQAARVIARLTRLDIVVKAQQSCKALLRSLSANTKEIANNIVRTEKELEPFFGLEEDGKFLETLQDDRKSLVSNLNKYQTSKNLSDTIADAGRVVDLYLPDKSELNQLREDIDLALTVRRLNDILEESPVPEIPDLEPLRALIDYTEAAAHIENSDVALDRCNWEIDALVEEIKAFDGEPCPVCGKPLRSFDDEDTSD